jgi:hypothetical protein
MNTRQWHHVLNKQRQGSTKRKLENSERQYNAKYNMINNQTMHYAEQKQKATEQMTRMEYVPDEELIPICVRRIQNMSVIHHCCTSTNISSLFLPAP